MAEIEIKCKTCGKIHDVLELEGKLKYDFKCRKCRTRNIGVITRIFEKKEKIK